MNLGIFYVEAHAEQGHHGMVKVYMWHACSKLLGKSNLLKNNYFRPAPFPIFVGELGCNVTHHRMHSSRHPPPPRIARICLGTCLILFRNVTWTEPRKTISLLTIERPGTEHCSGALSTELKRDCTINVLPFVTSNPKVLTQLIFSGVLIMITFFVVAVFQGVMVRLMLVLAPVACILSGISVSTVLTTYMKVWCSFYPPYLVPCGFTVQKIPCQVP